MSLQDEIMALENALQQVAANSEAFLKVVQPNEIATAREELERLSRQGEATIEAARQIAAGCNGRLKRALQAKKIQFVTAKLRETTLLVSLMNDFMKACSSRQ